jgi:hypothetical protein
MATTATYGAVSTPDHNTQLRKAVITATIGTAIEWYDFFIYGTAAGLIFGKLYFPNEDPLTGTQAANHRYRRLLRRPRAAKVRLHSRNAASVDASTLADLPLR